MLDRIAELLIFGFAPLTIGMLFVPGARKAAGPVALGEVRCREPAALPESSVSGEADAALFDACGKAKHLGTDAGPLGREDISDVMRFNPM